ncbi:MAG: hypothetical protein S0880_19860 [Actinomycetota bacterium]|nr:hypothetical protein [Actinomycetota bacterium]
MPEPTVAPNNATGAGDAWPETRDVEPGAGHRRGTVLSFDDPRGIGVVGDATGEVAPFHCTAIADGSRTIEVGAPVGYDLVAGRLGRWEASRIVPTGAAQGSV